MDREWQYQLMNLPIVGFSSKNLWTTSFEKKSLMIFLRHFGCLFCRNLLSNLARDQEELFARGYQIILVHMSEATVSKEFFNSFGLKNYLEISDPYRSAYYAFQINEAKLGEMFYPQLLADIWESLKEGHRNGEIEGSLWQMPGLLTFFEGRIEKRFKFDSVGHLPDFLIFSE